MMGAGAYGSSGVTPPLVAHLWKTYAFPRMVYGLEVFNLYNLYKEIRQLEQLQRTVLRKIQIFPINTSLVAVYGLLGVRPSYRTRAGPSETNFPGKCSLEQGYLGI